MAKRTKRTALIATSMLAAACGRGTPTTLAPAEITVTQPEAGPTNDDAAASSLIFDRAVGLLTPYAFTHVTTPHRTVYTWTTHEQALLLQKTPRLLTREESPTRGSAYLDQVLEALAKNDDPIAKILYTSTFAKMRYAWHAPWATRQGWPGEQYGDELIAVTLKPESIILSLFTLTGAFSAQTISGQSMTLDQVAADPKRIAAIYFVSEATSPVAETIKVAPKATYRELALCNESMIESWSIGTPDIETELEKNAAAMVALADYLRTLKASPTLPKVAEAWITAPSRTPLALYQASLAFENDLYAADPATLSALADRLRATPKAVVSTYAPTMRFPGPGTPRGIPTVKRPPSGSRNNTFGTFGGRP